MDALGDVLGLGGAALLLTFCLGYGLGRRRGARDGFAHGLRYGPLYIRQQSWTEGRCLICGAGPPAKAASPEAARPVGADTPTAGGSPEALTRPAAPPIIETKLRVQS